MSKLFIALSFLLIYVSIAFGEALRIDIRGDLFDDTALTVFHGEVLIPIGGDRELFTGPYTIKISPEKESSETYDLTVDLLGLGPDFINRQYRFSLLPGEKMLIPSMPVKNDARINYSILIIDDTSSIAVGDNSISKADRWGISASVHYVTRYIKGSLIDYRWNVKMGYFENIYNSYRESFKLSMSEKIELFFHPERTDDFYIDPKKHYAILPLSRQIHLIYGHEIDAASPTPGAELVIYRLWGYGPRWMVAGLAHYYYDNELKLKNLIDRFDPNDLSVRLGDEAWVDSRIGSAFSGAFVHWLLHNHSQSKFMRLYKKSTSLDFRTWFEEIYGEKLQKILSEFIGFIQDYEPTAGELNYYASLYLAQNQIELAKKYYENLAFLDNDAREANLNSLATCLFWLGDYSDADTVYDTLIKLTGDRPELFTLKGDMHMAMGDFEAGIGLYEDAFREGHGNAGLRLVTTLINRESVDSALTIFGKLEGDVRRLLDYSIESGRLKIITGESADSLLNNAAARALSNTGRISHDPRRYFAAGRAYALLGEFEQAVENLNIAYFLEINPYHLSSILLEMGRTEDLRGDRQKAREYYNRVLSSNGGEYQKSLARKYIERRYSLGF